MFTNAIKNFKQRREKAFLNTTSINVEFFKKDLNTALNAVIEQLSDYQLTKANYCEVSYYINEKQNLIRNSTFVFTSETPMADDEYVLDDYFGGSCFVNPITTNKKNFGNIEKIYRVFQAFISELNAYNNICVVDEFFEEDEAIKIIFALN